MPHPPSPPPLAELLVAEPLALFLDFDGTLIELAEGPDEIRLDDGLRPLLTALSERLESRLAIVSGRSVEWLHAQGLGDHALSGTHGSELRLAGGALERPERPALLDEVEAAFATFAGARPGVIVERKPLAAGLHFRRVPEHEDAAHTFAAEWAERSRLAVQKGKMMVELRLPGGGKGEAVRAIMEQAPFAGARPVFIGDDVTDEDGFRAAREHGGFGITVGERDSEAARYRLAGVKEVHRWLTL